MDLCRRRTCVEHMPTVDEKVSSSMIRVWAARIYATTMYESDTIVYSGLDRVDA